MPSQLVAPVPITPPRRNLHVVTSEDLFASLNATLASNSSQPITPVRTIQENDYTVPAPPPPSPVSFQWQTTPIRR